MQWENGETGKFVTAKRSSTGIAVFATNREEICQALRVSVRNVTERLKTAWWNDGRNC